VGQDYSWLGSIVYIAQLVAQPMIAYFLVKLPTGKFAASMVLCWGIVLSCMAVTKNFKGLLATRFLLGCFEASVGKWSSNPRKPFADAHSSNLCVNHPDVVEKK
jgi:MFS family permease